MKGYKYRSIDQDNLENTLNRDVESLIANQLYASPFKALNDPFENIYNETISAQNEPTQEIVFLETQVRKKN